MTDLTLAKAIGANIAAVRKAKGYSQGWLADRLGIGNSNLCNVETGSRMAGVELLVRVAASLDVPLASLFAGIGTEPDAYLKGFEDGWRGCADEVESHLTWKPRDAR